MKFIAILIIIAGGYLIFTYNRALNWQMKVDNSWTSIKGIIEAKIDFVTNLISLTQKYLDDCEKLYELLVNQKNELMNSQSENENIERNDKLDKCIEQLFEFCDYYTDIDTNLAYNQFKNKFSNMKSNISENIKSYNDLVIQYNKMLNTSPNNYFYKMMGFNEKVLIDTDKQQLIEK